MARRVKIGIDVGGTFTHAVAVDADAGSLVGTATVATTHSAVEGVARGVVESMRRLLDTARIRPDEVILIAHSTTQATNALLEGDVASVGVIGMGRGWESWRARSQTHVDDIELAPGKRLRTFHRFLDTSRPADDARILRAFRELREEGAEVFVVSEAFGVDDPANERRGADLIRQQGCLAVAASDISQLYGLKVRTRTAIINASMMPRMLETASRTESAVRASGIACPLMVMRSDGGIMDIEEMRRRPILTMLSGPAAGIAAALMFVKVSDGIFLDVGGTSTDISVIRNGRPTVRTAEVGGHRLYVRTLDVRTVGIGGGSMARLDGRRIVDVGPRSAHIAGFAYPSFTQIAPGAALELELVQPLPRDPADYLAVRVAAESRASLAYTTTEAANALGLLGGYGKADSPTLPRISEWLAERLGTPARALARVILDKAAAKVGAVVERLIDEYRLDRHLVDLVGGGGGAGVIVRHLAERLGLPHRVAEHAEVLSAIGAALGMIQDSIERTVVNPTEADLVKIRRAAIESVVRMGASPDSVEVKVEVDTRRKRLIATARGTPEMRTEALATRALPEEELRALAARSCSLPPEAVHEVGGAGSLLAYQGRVRQRRFFGLVRLERHPVRLIDQEGVLRLKLSDAVSSACPLSALAGRLNELVDELTTYGDAGALLPDVFVALSGRVLDLSGLATRDQVLAVLRAESEALAADEPAVALVSRKRL